MEQAEFTVGYRDLSAEQQQLVRDTLQSLLSSPHFRKSKRYPALLEYVVGNALAGNTSSSKERIVGAEVFGRSADYDTSNDAIVRIAAGEVRKRMESYFQEHPEAPVRIDLPLGNYTAEFHFRSQPDKDAFSTVLKTEEDIPSPVAFSPSDLKSKNGRTPAWLIWVVALVVVLMAVGAGKWIDVQDQSRRDFWQPILHTQQPAVILTGEVPILSVEAPSPDKQAIYIDRKLRDESPIQFGDAMAAARICGIFKNGGRDCKVIPASSATVVDLRNTSVVLVGAFNNALTQRFLASLRFQLESIDSDSIPGTKTPGPKTRAIVDRFHPEANSAWKVGMERPLPESGDYAILGRFHSDINDGMVVVIAGLGPQGTDGAGEFISSPDNMQQILAQAPKDWKGVNFEAVLHIDLVQGNAGHVKVITTYFW
jgi:hypothetical protein